MTVTEAVAAIRAATFHDGDTQVTDAQITAKLDQALRRLRQRIVTRVPSLFESTTTPTIASGANSIAKPTDFERLVLLEKQSSGTYYYPVPVSGGLDRGTPPTICFYETSNSFVVNPDATAPGNYRLTIVKGPTTGYTTLEVPGGFEDVCIEEVAAWTNRRHEDDAREHAAEAQRIYREQMTYLLRRYGKHPVPGLVRTR